MNNNFNFNDIVKLGGGKIDHSSIEKAKQTGDASALVNNLSQKDKEKLNQILQDKSELEKILKSPQAQMLLKMFQGGKNG